MGTSKGAARTTEERERIRQGMAARSAVGLAVGRPPFGWRVVTGGRLAMCEQEQRVIRRVRMLRSKGKTLREITGALGRTGYVSRVGKPLGLTQVARILAREWPSP